MKDNISEINVVYQPIVALKTGKVYGAEALVRPVGTHGDAINTSEFISKLETDGGIEELDCFVFERACRDLSGILKEFPEIRFCGNASRRTLEQPDLADRFFAIADKYGIIPGSIVAEVTESYLDVDMHKLNGTLMRLRGYGFKIAVDDFGKGCSCLSFLNEIECDTIKLDKFFLRNFYRPKTRIILDWTLELARRLGLTVLAEGVETDEQAAYLRDRGCDFAQGYYRYKPMGLAELKTLLREKERRE